MMKRLFLLVLLPLFLHSAEKLSFQTLIDLEKKSQPEILEALKKWNNKEITVRGYTYNEDGVFVVSCDPNLPSCCRKNSPYRKILLDQTTKYQMADVTGFFAVNQDSTPLFFIKEATFKPVERDTKLYLLTFIFVLGIAIAILCRRYYS